MVLRRAAMPVLALLASYFMYFFSKLANDSPLVVSPQGCEMSWMSPHYILETGFNKSWSPLASRYSLWLYREVGFDAMDGRRGTPVLFIPGNAGSSRQVRSIASSAAQQFQQKWSRVTEAKPLDFFAVEFNEDFSAIHPPTLLTETKYSSQAIRYILSLYPTGTKIIIMGHSMGGIVAQLLMTEMDDTIIRGVFTMSTPSLLAPVRFDRRSEDVYKMVQGVQRGELASTTPLITVCGGSTDSQITSEICTLPERQSPLRITVMTTSLEGAWTGVGHREMVWCHQVRSQIATSALALAHDKTSDDSIGRILRTRPTQTTPSLGLANITGLDLHHIRDANNLELGSVELGMKDAGVHLIGVPTGRRSHFILFAYRTRYDDSTNEKDDNAESGAIRILYCSPQRQSMGTQACVKFAGHSSLIPRHSLEDGFPLKDGVPDNDSLLLFEAELDVPASGANDHIAIVTNAQSTERWIVAAVEEINTPLSSASMWDAIKPGGVSFTLPSWSKTRSTTMRLPHLLSNSLVVYRVKTELGGQCKTARVPPMVVHRPSEVETHYHSPSHPFYLQSHRTGPFVSTYGDSAYEPSLTILSSGECGVQRMEISVAWMETLARLGVRYWMGLAMWSIAVVGILQLMLWRTYDTDGHALTSGVLIKDLAAKWMVPLGLGLVGISWLPLPKEYILGNAGQPGFSIIALPMWFFACGLVSASRYIVRILGLSLRFFMAILRLEANGEEHATSKRWIASILSVIILVATFIPFQVAFMIVFLVAFWTYSRSPLNGSRTSDGTVGSSSPTPETWRGAEAKRAIDFHMLLLLTWHLPFAAPIMVVWIRTLQTAGYTVPFDGDHNVVAVLPWLLLGEALASGRHLRREHVRWKQLVTYALAALVSVTALLLGPRFPYLVFEVSTVFVAWLAVTRIQRPFGHPLT